MSGPLPVKRETLVLPGRAELRASPTAKVMAEARPSRVKWVVLAVAVLLMLLGAVWWPRSGPAVVVAPVVVPTVAPAVVATPEVKVEPVVAPTVVAKVVEPPKEDLAPLPVKPERTSQDRVIVVPSLPEERVVTVDDEKVRKCNAEVIAYSKRLELGLRSKLSGTNRERDLNGLLEPVRRVRKNAAANDVLKNCETMDAQLDKIAESEGL